MELKFTNGAARVARGGVARGRGRQKTRSDKRFYYCGVHRLSCCFRNRRQQGTKTHPTRTFLCFSLYLVPPPTYQSALAHPTPPRPAAFETLLIFQFISFPTLFTLFIRFVSFRLFSLIEVNCFDKTTTDARTNDYYY